MKTVWEVHINGGRVPTGLEAVAWAQQVEALGAGEIVLTSMDADGTKAGYDIEQTRGSVKRLVFRSSPAAGAAHRAHACCVCRRSCRRRARRQHLPHG